MMQRSKDKNGQIRSVKIELELNDARYPQSN